MKFKSITIFLFSSSFFLTCILSIWKIMSTLQGLNFTNLNFTQLFLMGILLSLSFILIGNKINYLIKIFSLSFLFILARLQAIPQTLYEAADVDGASPIQKFIHITLPQIIAIISILFMIRFIWNFNKFEDIFLLTGGASGTRTLPINVYQQGFAVSDIGMGSAVSIVIVMLLLSFMIIYFRLIGKRANEV